MTLEATPDVTATVAPGWYTDPANEDSQRWWDGEQWTEHVSVAIAGGPDLDLSPAGVAPVQQAEYVPLQPLTLTGPASQFHSNTHHSQLTIDRMPQAKKSRRALIVVLVLGALAIGGVIAFTLYTTSVAPTDPGTGTINAPVSQVNDAPPASDAAAKHTRAVLMADMRKINSAMKSARGSSTLWPSTVVVDPKKGTLATGTGKKLGAVPLGTVVSYAVTVDGTGYTLTVTDPKVNVGIRYASATSEFTSF